MIQIKHEYSDLTAQWWYIVYENNRYVKVFYWKWCAKRFVKKLIKNRNKYKNNEIVFEISD